MELYRTESVEVCINRGITSKWAQDHILAHGLAGQRNPLGNALIHLEATIKRLPDKRVLYSPASFRMAQYHLSGELIRMKICKSRDATDFAEWALKYFIDKRCHGCMGTGVLNIEQEPCNTCGGTGGRPTSAIVLKVIKIIEGYQDWMEAQLCKKLRNTSPNYPVEAKPQITDVNDCGSYTQRHNRAE